MAVKSRILGRDVQIRLSQGGNPLTTITAIKNFVFETRVRILSEGYLGEVGNRKDEIFDEVGGSFVIHPEDPEVLAFQKFLVDRAIQRSSSEEQVTITFRVSFPSGKVARIVIPKPVFGPLPVNFGARDSYVEASVTYEAEGFTLFT